MKRRATIKQRLTRCFSLAGLIGLCLLPVRSAAAEEIKLGILSFSATHWPQWVAKEKGYFKEQDLQVREFHVRSVSPDRRSTV